MFKKVWVISKINLKNIRIPFFVTGLVFAVTFVESIIYLIIAAAGGRAGDQLYVSSGNYFWMLVILAAIFIPTKNFRRIVNLGGKRGDFFRGNLACYAMLAGAASIFHSLFYYVYECFLVSTGYYVGFETYIQNPALLDSHYVSVSVIEVFGWLGNGTVVVIIQQFALLFFVAVLVHTISAIQDKWYGWVTDTVIAAVLAVFIPIAPLRALLLSFFNLIISDVNPLAQIIACLLLSVAVYSLNKPIFARKVI
ncbi:MAG: hypothetical protein LBH28_09240 [Oscillospiraceae bacterium]|jgi:hypothetical protein|nr:hypothetical protein [Oscillospiraceae bacterium]